MDKSKQIADQVAIAAVRAEVIAEFAEQLSAVSFWPAINAEVERRIRRQLHPSARRARP